MDAALRLARVSLQQGDKVGALVAMLSSYAVPVAFLAAYGLLRLSSTLFNELRDVVFFVSVTVLSLLVAFRALERRKWA